MKYQEIPFKGHSMWPLLNEGDQILVETFESPKALSEFEEGELLFYREHREWVAHRLILHKGRKVLKGDFANRYFWEEEPVVWGRVHGFVRNQKAKTWESSHRGAKWVSKVSQRVLETSGAFRKLQKLILYLSVKIFS